MALRTSLTTTSVPFSRDTAFCSQSYKRAKHPSGEGKATEPGIWQNASEDSGSNWTNISGTSSLKCCLKPGRQMQSCTWPRYQSSFWSPAADHFLWLHLVYTKDIWATADLYTVVRHQWLCAKKASCGKTWNPVHMTRNVLVQQGKIQLQEFLVFYILPTPSGFHRQTQKGRQFSLAISVSLVTFKSDK